MNNTSLRPLLTLGLLFAPSIAAAQAPLYLVTQRSAQFVALNNGTVQPNIQFGQAAMVPIGFTFNYFGEAFTHVAISDKGVLSLQQSCVRNRCEFDEFCNGNNVCERSFISAPFNNPIPSLNPPSRVIAPFWDDLFIQPGNNPAAEVRTAVTGAAPNRDFVVEWRNVRHSFFGGGPQSSRVSFQVRLSEATGNIRLAYGPFTAGNDTQAFAGYIGIQSASGPTWIAGTACAIPPSRCGSTTLSALTNQVIEIGRPNTAELTGKVVALAGGLPGQSAQIAVTAINAGLQPTPAGGFSADVYIGLSSPIITARDTNLGRLRFSGAIAPGASVTATLTAVIPAALAIGNYVVAAHIDSQGQVVEATESNNLVEASSTMLIGADLAAVIDTLPSGQPGQAGVVEGRILNASSRVPAIAWRIVLSEDGAVDASDTLLASGTANVPAGGEFSIRANVTFPNLPVAYYQLLLVVDPNDVLDEVDESNNIGGSTQFILGPELQPAFIEPPARTGPGEDVELTAVIDSIGSSLPAVPFRAWLSTDQRFSPATDFDIGTGTTAVGAGEQVSAIFTAHVPAIAPPGNYFLVLEVDPNDVIAELDETNNVWVGTDPVRLTGPDVAAQAIDSDTLAFRGRTFAVSTRLENVGGQTVRNVFYSFHLSVNQLITVTDPEIFRGGPITLAPGEAVDVTETATIPANFVRGQYYLGIIADSNSAIVEDQENNNIRRKLVPVIVRDPAPDFTTIEASAPASAASGELLTLQRLIENAGNAPGIGPYAVRLVQEGQASEDGVEIGRGTITLTEGASATGVDRFFIPSSVPGGQYSVEYVMDPDNTIDELVETNNVLRADQVIEVEPAQLEILTKNLPVGSVGVPYDVTLAANGGLGALSWTIDVGTLPAGLTLDPSGRISGSPEGDASSHFTVRVSDGRTWHTRELLLLVSAGQVALDLLTRAVPAAYVGQPYEYPLVAVGGVAPYIWSADGELPGGFTLTSSGTLSGVGTAAAGSRVINFRVEDARGDAVERPIAFRVLDGAVGVRFGDGALPDGAVGEGYEAVIAVAGGEPPYMFALGAGELPPGLALEDGTVRGTPARAGSYTVELRVTDSKGNFDLALFVVSISAAGELKFVTTGLPAGEVGTGYTDESGQTVQLRVLAPPDTSSVTFGLVSGALPTGITLSPAGRLTGTPTAPGVFAFVAVVADAQGRSARGAFGMAIVGAPVEPEPINPSTGCGCATTPDSGGLLTAALVFGLALVARRRRVWPMLALAAVVIAPFAASAQRGFDGGVGGADSGTVVGPSLYFLSTRAEAYVERTGGPSIPFQSRDDDAQFVTIPFPFKFYETDYTEVSVGTNGYLSFSHDARSLGNDTFPSSNFQGGPYGVIAPFWDDLINPTATTYLEGTAPSRVFIIQWSNVDRCCNPSGRAQLNFQIHLFEGAAGRFEIHYGPDNGGGGERFDASSGFMDETGARGEAFLPCTPSCGQNDYATAVGNVYIALQDAGEDVFANGIEARVSGIGRVYQGVPFPVTVSYSSYHGEPIGPFTYRVHLMGRNDRVPNNPIFESAPITLGPYDSRSDALQISLPLSVMPGRYRLALEVDSQNTLVEPSETNNLAFTTNEVLVAARGPDFTVSSVVPTAPAIVAPGAMVTVHVGLENAGNIDGSVGYRVVLSGNRAPTASDAALASGNVAIPLLRAVTATVQVTLPSDLRAGEYWIGAIVDPDDMVVELSEVNNIGVARRSLVVRGGPLAVLTTALPPAYHGVEYSARLVADAPSDAHWTIDAGALPDGFQLRDNGEIFGRATAEGTSTFTVQVASGADVAAKALTIEVRPGGGPLVIVTHALLPAVVGEAYPPAPAGSDVASQQHIIAAGGVGAATFRVTSGALPEGITLDADGYLHGSASRTGTFSFVAEASDGTSTTDLPFDLLVIDSGRLTLIPDALPNAEVDSGYHAQLVAVGVVDPAKVEYALVEGAGNLPEGLVLDTHGTITGTAARIGAYQFSVRVTEAVDARIITDTATFELAVTSPAGFTITPTTLPDATVGVAYSVFLEARQGRAPFTWATLDVRRLPRGLVAQVVTQMGIEKLQISGTPEEIPSDAQLGDRTGGISTFAVGVTDAAGRSAEAALALRVVAPPPPPPTKEESGGCSCATSSSGAPIAEVLLLVAAGLFIRRRRP